MDYINMYGSIKHCWEVHKKVMRREGEPAVTYSTFRARIRDLHWDPYKAIHTPAVVEKRDKNRRWRAGLHKVAFRIKRFFRKLFNLGWEKHRIDKR